MSQRIQVAARYLNLFETTSDALRALAEALDTDEFDHATDEAELVGECADAVEEIEEP